MLKKIYQFMLKNSPTKLRPLLTFSGLGCIVLAFYESLGLGAGLGSGGVSLLVLEYLMSRDETRG